MTMLSDKCCLAISILLLIACSFQSAAQDSALYSTKVLAVSKPVLLRSFVNYKQRKLTHVLNVGHPAGINYSYDLKQGAIFQVWRGKFMDASQMWVNRGEPQLATPLDASILLSDAPIVAVLPDETAPWPDSVAFDDYTGHGYTLNNKRLPTFSYNIKGQEVTDSITVPENNKGLDRIITLINPSQNIYCRLAVSTSIDYNSKTNLYTIDGKSYSISIDKKYKAFIRNSANNKELLVRYQAQPITYSIIW